MKFNDILMVCSGNICRSPTAELILKNRKSDIVGHIGSAGLIAKDGLPMDEIAASVLEDKSGFVGSLHRSRKISKFLIDNSDLILVMESKHMSSLFSVSDAARGKTFLLGKWIGDREIPDPYRQDRIAYDYVYKMIDESVNQWLKHL